MLRSEHQEGAWYERLARGAPLAVFVAAGLFVAYKLLPILELVAIAMLIALILRTIVKGLEKRGAPTWLAVTTLVGVIMAFGAFLWLVVVPRVVREAQILISRAPEYLNSLERLASRVTFVPDLSQIVDRLQDLLSQLTGSLPSLITSLASLAGAVVAILFLAIYLAARPGPLISGILRLAPREKRAAVRELIHTIEIRLRGWIAGTAIVSLFVGGGGGLGLWVLGVPLPLTFGLLAGVLNVVPYLGSTLGALLPALVALTISPVKALLVVVLFVALNQVEGNFLQPMVMGRTVQLHQATILIAFLAFGTLLGIVGVLVAVPGAVVLATLMDVLSSEEPSQEEKQAKGESASGNSRA